MNKDFVITKITRVVYVGKDEYNEKISSFNSNMTECELILKLSGDTTVYFGDKVMHEGPDTIRFLPKGDAGRYVVERKIKGEYIFVAFDVSSPIWDEALVMKSANIILMRTLFKKIFAIWVAKNEGYYHECFSLLYKILAELQKHNYMPLEKYNIIKPAIDYIEENFLEKKIPNEMLSVKCNISESYFKRLFKEKFGISSCRYIIQLKINYACDLLQYSEYSITQISEICGYDNVYYFSRQFKIYTGITPKEFKNKYISSK